MISSFNSSIATNVTSRTFCDCASAYSAGVMNGMFYACIIVLILLVVLIFYFNIRKNREEEEDEDEEDEFYNGEEI